MSMSAVRGESGLRVTVTERRADPAPVMGCVLQALGKENRGRTLWCTVRRKKMSCPYLYFCSLSDALSLPSFREGGCLSIVAS